MFKKYNPKQDITGVNQVKSSVARAIRGQLTESYPYLEETGLIDELLPKKEPLMVAKCGSHVDVLVRSNEALFFRERDMPWCPVLRLLHKYPDMMPRLRADKGAIKFVLSGAHIMCPGLTSAGATLHDEVGENVGVAIYAEGKEVAMAIGVTKMSTKDMVELNKGIGVDNCHYLNDGLWKHPLVQ